MAGLSENSKILSSFLFFSILWLLLTGNSGTSFLISLRPKEKFKCLGDPGKQKVPGNKQKTTFRQKSRIFKAKTGIVIVTVFVFNAIHCESGCCLLLILVDSSLSFCEDKFCLFVLLVLV